MPERDERREAYNRGQEDAAEGDREGLDLGRPLRDWSDSLDEMTKHGKDTLEDYEEGKKHHRDQTGH